ncbi:MAG: hypothetical protein MJZ61_09120 [Bacteroidales bacterium]|nr:hypothetical protein [Bacteroidales bacterium]
MLDVNKRVFFCEHCKREYDPESIRCNFQERLDKDEARVRRKLRTQLDSISIYSCKNCGCIKAVDGHILSGCDNCMSPLEKVRLEAKDFPTYIIPFTISRIEAVDIAKAWLQEQKQTQRISNIQDNVYLEICKSYLPYKMVYGDFGCHFYNYDLAGCVYGILVNESHRFNNILLDAVEPFDKSEITDFDISYLLDAQALRPDIGDKKMKQRRDWEIQNAYRPSIRKALGKEFHYLAVKDDSGFSYSSIYLPVYTLSIGRMHVLAVNGQTGRVAYLEGTSTVHSSDKAFAGNYNLTLMNKDMQIEDFCKADISWRDMVWDRHIDTINMIIKYYKFLFMGSFSIAMFSHSFFKFDNLYNLLIMYLVPLMVYLPIFFCMKPTIYFKSTSLDDVELDYIDKSNRKKAMIAFKIYAAIGLAVALFLWYWLAPHSSRELSPEEKYNQELYIGFRFKELEFDTTQYYWTNVSGIRHYARYKWYNEQPDSHGFYVSGAGSTSDNIFYDFDYNFGNAGHPKFAFLRLMESDYINIKETDKMLFDSTEYLYNSDYFFFHKTGNSYTLLPIDDSAANVLFDKYKKWIAKRNL